MQKSLVIESNLYMYSSIFIYLCFSNSVKVERTLKVKKRKAVGMSPDDLTGGGIMFCNQL